MQDNEFVTLELLCLVVGVSLCVRYKTNISNSITTGRQ